MSRDTIDAGGFQKRVTSSWSAESFSEAVDGKRRNKANLAESSWNQRPIMMNPVARISLLTSAAFVPPRRRTETDRCGAARVRQAANSKIRFGFVMTKQTQFRRTPVESTADCRSTNDRAAGSEQAVVARLAVLNGTEEINKTLDEREKDGTNPISRNPQGISW